MSEGAIVPLVSRSANDVQWAQMVMAAVARMVVAVSRFMEMQMLADRLNQVFGESLGL